VTALDCVHKRARNKNAWWSEHRGGGYNILRISRKFHGFREHCTILINPPSGVVVWSRLKEVSFRF
jgi:hypothetical protein